MTIHPTEALTARSEAHWQRANESAERLVDAVAELSPESTQSVLEVFGQLKTIASDQAAALGAMAEMEADHTECHLANEAEARGQLRVWTEAAVMVTELIESRRLVMKASELAGSDVVREAEG